MFIQVIEECGGMPCLEISLFVTFCEISDHIWLVITYDYVTITLNSEYKYADFYDSADDLICCMYSAF